MKQNKLSRLVVKDRPKTLWSIFADAVRTNISFLWVSTTLRKSCQIGPTGFGVFQCDFRCFCQSSDCELLVHDVILNSDDSFMAGREPPYGPKEFSQSPNETPHMAPGIEEV